MTTNAATNLATQAAAAMPFHVDFDKKKLTEKLLACEAEHQRLQPWLESPFIRTHLEAALNDRSARAIARLTWGIEDKGERLQEIMLALNNPEYSHEQKLVENLLESARTNNSPARPLRLAGLFPCPVGEIKKNLEGLMEWKKDLSKQRLSPLYQTLITLYYLTLIQPMGTLQTAFNQIFLYQSLQKMNFGILADYILIFYGKHETILATTLASCYHARHKKCHQQPWFQLFCEGWAWALAEVDERIRSYCLRACYIERAQECLDSKRFNERQHRLALHLLQEGSQDRKSLQRCLWYKTLYQGLTKRTEERDYALLKELGFIT